MNILYIALLFCVVCHVLASDTGSSASQVSGGVISIKSTPEAGEFRDAIDARDVRTAQDIFTKGNDEQKKYYGEYLISLGSERLVVLIKTSGIFKSWLPRVIMLYAEEGLINKVFKEVNLSGENLISVAFNADLACAPIKFISLLERITDKRYQDEAVRNGITALFDANKTVCLDSLLSALERSTTLDQDAKDRAVKEAFLNASIYPTDNRASSLAKGYYDDPAVLAEDYSDALYNSYGQGGPECELFNWLLREADLGDLQAVKSNPKWEGMSPEFKGAINGALGTAKPAGTRLRDVQVAERAEEVEEEVGYLEGIRDIGDIISGYVTRVTPTPRRRKQRAQRAAEKALKQTTSSVTSTSTGVEGSKGTSSKEGDAGKK